MHRVYITADHFLKHTVASIQTCRLEPCLTGEQAVVFFPQVKTICVKNIAGQCFFLNCRLERISENREWAVKQQPL